MAAAILKPTSTLDLTDTLINAKTDVVDLNYLVEKLLRVIFAVL